MSCRLLLISLVTAQALIRLLLVAEQSVLHVACLWFLHAAFLRLGQFDQVVRLLMQLFFIRGSFVLDIKTGLVERLPLPGLDSLMRVMPLKLLLPCALVLHFTTNEHDLIVIINRSTVLGASHGGRIHEARVVTTANNGLELVDDAI